MIVAYREDIGDWVSREPFTALPTLTHPSSAELLEIPPITEEALLSELGMDIRTPNAYHNRSRHRCASCAAGQQDRGN